MRRIAIVAVALLALAATGAQADEPEPQSSTTLMEDTSGIETFPSESSYAIEDDWWQTVGESGGWLPNNQNCGGIGVDCEEDCFFLTHADRGTWTRPLSFYQWSIHASCSTDNTSATLIHYCTGAISAYYNGVPRTIEWSEFSYLGYGESCYSSRSGGTWLEVDRRTYKFTLCHSAHIRWNNGLNGPFVMGWHCHDDHGWMPRCNGNVLPQNQCDLP